MTDDELAGLPEEQLAFLRESKEMGSEAGISWKVLTAASESAAAWAGVVTAAKWIIRKHGQDPDQMQAFFSNVLERPLDEKWKRVASAAASAASSKPSQVITEVQKVVNSVPIEEFRTLIYLSWVEYCVKKYRDDPEKLRDCIANG